MSYLTRIIQYKQDELESVRRRTPLNDVRAMVQDAEPSRDFYRAVSSRQADEVSIIAEAKKASPSQGIIVEDFDPVRITQAYEDNGAAALSVLTDEHFFQGQLSFIGEVKAHVNLPILRKDFTLNEYHIYEARAAQADAVLLIANVLEATQLADYHALANELGMTALLEVHDQEDLDKLMLTENGERFSQSLIGINNRNLNTFETDLSVSETLRKSIPAQISVVAESGINQRADIERLNKAGFNIFLIGEALLRSTDIGETLKSLLGR